MKLPLGESQVPPIYEFVTWFFEACNLPSEYRLGKALSFGFICRLMSRKNDFALGEQTTLRRQPGTEHINPKSVELLPYFYRLILKGLLSREDQVISAIIINSTSLFTIDLPGVYVLAPAFVEVTREMVGNLTFFFLFSSFSSN